MKGWLKIALILLAAAVICISLLPRVAQTPESIYEGKKLSSLVERAILKSDDNAGRVLKRALASADGFEKVQIQKRLVDCAMKAPLGALPGCPLSIVIDIIIIIIYEARCSSIHLLLSSQTSTKSP